MCALYKAQQFAVATFIKNMKYFILKIKSDIVQNVVSNNNNNNNFCR